MPNVTKFPQTITQTTGGPYATFNNKDNIKTKANYSQTQLIKGKKQSPNRPSIITLKKFRTGIKTGSRTTKVQVHYKQMKVAYNNKHCNVPAPTIHLYNGNKKLQEKKGQAPTKDPKEETVTFYAEMDYNVINSDDFTVYINYPANANDNSGYVRLYYVYITVYYFEPDFRLSGSMGQTYNGTMMLEIACTNTTLVNTSPSVTIALENGLLLPSYSISRCVKVNNRTLVWTPRKGMDVDTLMIELDTSITFPSGTESVTCSVTVSENLSGHSKTISGVVSKTAKIDTETDDEEEPTYEDTTDNPIEEIITLTQDEETEVIFTIDDTTWNGIIEDIYEKGIHYNWWTGTLDANLQTILNNFYIHFWDGVATQQGSYLSVNHKISHKDEDSWSDHSTYVYLKDFVNKSTQLTLKGTSTGYDEILIQVHNDIYHFQHAPGYSKNLSNKWKFDIKPSNLTTPNATILTLSQEELNRLGDGYTYTLQSYVKEIPTSGTYVRKWGKNFLIGIFNNPISPIEVINIDGEIIEHDPTDYNSLTTADIIENAEYWSQSLTNVNTYENLECEFQYNEEYPFYIIITGDYPESTDSTTIKFTEPHITETEYYEQQTPNGVYPVPIDDLVLNDGSTSEINITPGNTSSTIVFYDLPLPENFGTNEEIAIRGLCLKGTFEQNTDDLILNAKLVNDKHESKERSIVLDEQNTLDAFNEFSLGQVGDLWGYSILDIQNLEDWEIHLTLNNSINDYNATANYGNIRLETYYETIEQTSTRCLIEGEDLAYYGVFITDLKIPEGLKTDTDYITVDGTDTNDPYRQNIRSKTIEIDFEIGDNCDLEGATLSLRELARLLTNRRDKYNRPIPKRIEFTHYPDVYWEYIMEEPFDNDVDISSYSVKVKLTVPAGTSYDKTPTSTNTTGYVSGLAAIRPIIQLTPLDSLFTIEETITGQEFNMGYNGDWTGKIVEIDCENRNVYLKNNEEDTDPINISKYVDYNSDFFRLYEEYNFTANGCVIRSIDYSERW